MPQTLSWQVYSDRLAYAHTRTHTYAYEFISPGRHRVAVLPLTTTGGRSTAFDFATAALARAYCEEHAAQQTRNERSPNATA
jgi:hypothetical protein